MGLRRALPLLFVLLASSAALAQDGLLVGDQFVSGVRNFGDVLGPGPVVEQRQLFAGGRLVLIGQTVFDTRHGAAVYRPDRVDAEVLALDAARPRLFERRPDGIWGVDVSTGTTLRLLAVVGSSVARCAHAASANRLLCAVARPDLASDVVEMDLATLSSRTVAVVRIKTACLCLPPAWVVTPDGRRLYFGEESAGPFPESPTDSRLALLDTTTARITRSPAPGPGFGGGNDVYWEDLNQRVIVTSGRQLRLFSKDLEELPFVSPGNNCSSAVVSPHTGRLYVGKWDNVPSQRSAVSVRVYDAATLAPLAAAAPVPTNALSCNVVVLAAPGAPRDVTAAISGHTVTLAWTNVGAASGFVLDVGLAPGRTDLSVSLGPDAHTSFAGVPSGTYYLRLRGGNEFGGGRASDEIRLLVP